MRNQIKMERWLGADRVTVLATYDEARDAWNLVSRVNGKVHDRRTSGDAVLEAWDMITVGLDDATQRKHLAVMTTAKP